MPHRLILDNIKAQANRLSRLQNIQLCDAYDAISWAFYRCNNYTDLRSRLIKNNEKSHWFDLAKISPTCPNCNAEDLEKYMSILIDRLSSKLIFNTNRIGLSELIYRVFGFEKSSDNARSHFPNYSSNGWKAISNNQISQNLLLENYICLNNVTYRLLAISVFMPQYWPFKDEENLEKSSYLSPFSSHDYNICTDSLAWRNAVLNFISNTIEDIQEDLVQFKEPKIKLTSKELDIQNSIQYFIENFCLDYDENAALIPLLTENNDNSTSTYLIFGYPVENKPELNLLNQKFIFNTDKYYDYDSQTIFIDNIIVNLEWISSTIKKDGVVENNTDSNNYFLKTINFLSKQDEFKLILNAIEDSSHLFFFKPATDLLMQSDLKLQPATDENKIIWMLKAENTKLAITILNHIRDNRLYRHVSKHGHEELICKVELDANENYNLAILLNINSNIHKESYNLIFNISGVTKDDKTTLYITISPDLINLFSAIKQKVLVSSLKSGLINHAEIDFFEEILKGKTSESYQNLITQLPDLQKGDKQKINSIESNTRKDNLDFITSLRSHQFDRDFNF